MNLRSKLFRDISIIATLFGIILLLFTLHFYKLNRDLNLLIKEATPTLEAMEHMLIDVYQDSIILYHYLNVNDYDNALLYDREVQASSDRCRQIEKRVENLILTGTISDKKIITDYNSANKIHHEVGYIKSELLTLHKRELATGINLKEDKQHLLQEHDKMFEQAVNEFTVTINAIRQRNEDIQLRLLRHTNIYLITLFVLICIFLSVLIIKIKNFSNNIVNPLDETISKMGDFVDGNYKLRLKPKDGFSEINDLQNNLNNVFEVIDEITSKNPNVKENIELKLLKTEYLDLLKVIDNRMIEKKNTTITDLKKHLNITHPTVLARIKFLHNNGYIEIRKNGREKYLILTSKVSDL